MTATSIAKGHQRHLEEPVLSISLLGGFRVALRSRIISDSAWRIRKAQSLIKLLALTSGHRAHRERLLEAFWPHLDPRAAANNLHQTLHFARRALQPELSRRRTSDFLSLSAEVIVLGPPERLSIDIELFEARCAAARKSRDPSAYYLALDLYQGDLLPDDLYEEWAGFRREELRQEYLSLLLDLATLHESRREFEPATEALDRLAAAEPTHEEARVRLMRLLARTGHRTQALRQFERLREALRGDLGVEPEPATRQLFQEILEGRLGFRRTTASPPLQAVARSARRRRPRPSTGKPGARDGPRTNLRAPLTSFVGREPELAEVRQLLAAVRLLTLVGPGGCGKTRLALRLVEEILPEFVDGIWLAELAGLSEPEFLPRTVAGVFGIREERGQDVQVTLANALRARQLLLVLDNCEHLARSCAALVANLLQDCPQLKILTTSREVLRVPGEMAWRVPPLSLPENRALSDPTQSDAVRLLVERAQLTRPEFTLTPENASAAVDLCRRLDGLPLAIELAAARLRVLSLAEMIGRIDRRFELLSAGAESAPGRHQTLEAAIGWSYGLLTPEERIFFNRLAVFRGGFALEAAERVCGDSAWEDDALDLLTHLVDKSMVVVEETRAGALRYRLLETLREYGWQRLKASGELERQQQAHAAFFHAQSEEAARTLRGPAQTVWLDALERDHDNFRAALEWAHEHHSPTALRIAGRLGQFWYMHGHFSEGRTRLRQALAAPGDAAEPAARAIALGFAGMLARAQGDYEEANQLVGDSLAISRRRGDTRGMAFALSTLGVIARNQGDLHRARRLVEESLVLATESGDEEARAVATQSVGEVAHRQGDLERAGSALRESFEIWTRTGNLLSASNALTDLGNVYTDQGNTEAGRQCHQESVAILRRLGDRLNLAYALPNLANALSLLGDRSAAQAAYEETLTIGRETGNRRGQGFALNGLGSLARDRGDFEEASKLYTEALHIRGALGEKMEVSKTLESAAKLAHARREPARAVTLAAAALAIRESIGATTRPADRPLYYFDVAAPRRILGERAFERAWAKGQAMTLEQAVAYGLAGLIPHRSSPLRRC